MKAVLSTTVSLAALFSFTAAGAQTVSASIVPPPEAPPAAVSGADTPSDLYSTLLTVKCVGNKVEYGQTVTAAAQDICDAFNAEPRSLKKFPSFHAKIVALGVQASACVGKWGSPERVCLAYVPGDNEEAQLYRPSFRTPTP